MPKLAKQNCSRDNESARGKFIVLGRRGLSNATGSSQGHSKTVLMRVGPVAQIGIIPIKEKILRPLFNRPLFKERDKILQAC